MYELLLLYYDNMQILLKLGWKDSLFVNANQKINHVLLCI